MNLNRIDGHRYGPIGVPNPSAKPLEKCEGKSHVPFENGPPLNNLQNNTESMNPPILNGYKTIINYFNSEKKPSFDSFYARFSKSIDKFKVEIFKDYLKNSQNIAEKPVILATTTLYTFLITKNQSLLKEWINQPHSIRELKLVSKAIIKQLMEEEKQSFSDAVTHTNTILKKIRLRCHKQNNRFMDMNSNPVIQETDAFFNLYLQQSKRLHLNKEQSDIEVAKIKQDLNLVIAEICDDIVDGTPQINIDGQPRIEIKIDYNIDHLFNSEKFEQFMRNFLIIPGAEEESPMLKMLKDNQNPNDKKSQSVEAGNQTITNLSTHFKNIRSAEQLIEKLIPIWNELIKDISAEKACEIINPYLSSVSLSAHKDTTNKTPLYIINGTKKSRAFYKTKESENIYETNQNGNYINAVRIGENIHVTPFIRAKSDSRFDLQYNYHFK